MTHSIHPRLMLTVLALMVVTGLATAPQPTQAAGPWYVITNGSDSNDCLSPATACATINGAINKASSGDTIYVATGKYTSTSGSQVVLANTSVILILEVNGAVLGTRSDSAISRLTGIGLVSSPYADNPNSDARLDNFSVTSDVGGAAITQHADRADIRNLELGITNLRLEPEFIPMDWYVVESVDVDWHQYFSIREAR